MAQVRGARYRTLSERDKLGPLLDGCIYLSTAHTRTRQGPLHLLVAIDPVSDFALVEAHEEVTGRVIAKFLRTVDAAAPYEILTALTDNSTLFLDFPSGGGVPLDGGSFTNACFDLDINHQLGPTLALLDRSVRSVVHAVNRAIADPFPHDGHHQFRRRLAELTAAGKVKGPGLFRRGGAYPRRRPEDP